MTDPLGDAPGPAARRGRDRRRLAAAVGRLVALHLSKTRAGRPAEEADLVSPGGAAGRAAPPASVSGAG